jgi:hypothetical protein
MGLIFICRDCLWRTKWVFHGVVDWRRRFWNLPAKYPGLTALDFNLWYYVTWVVMSVEINEARNQTYCWVVNSIWLARIRMMITPMQNDGWTLWWTSEITWETLLYRNNKWTTNLQFSQEASSGPYTDPDQSSPYHPILSL